MSSSALAALLAPLTAAVLLVDPAAPAPRMGGEDPVAGVRAIARAQGTVAPECLTVEGDHRVTVATLCFKEGRDHTWTIEPVPAQSGTYAIRRGEGCLTLDATRSPNLTYQLCMKDKLGQAWRITERAPGEYQLAQGAACVTAESGRVDAEACHEGRDNLGRDASGQVWKILKDPQSVVPDPTFGRGTDGK